MGSKSFLAGVSVVQNLLALWLLLRDLKVTMAAALSLAIFAGASCVASTPYRAPTYTLVAMTLTLVSVLAGQKRSRCSWETALLILSSSVPLMQS